MISVQELRETNSKSQADVLTTRNPSSASSSVHVSVHEFPGASSSRGIKTTLDTKKADSAAMARAGTTPSAPPMGAFVPNAPSWSADPQPVKPISVPTPAISAASPVSNEGSDENATDEEAGVIRCICQCDDDDGFTIQCDRCSVWQHCACFGMSQSSVPDEYLCEECDPRPVDVEFARNVQRRRIQGEARKAAHAATTLHAGAAKTAWDMAIGESPASARRKPSQTAASTSSRRSPTAQEMETPQRKPRKKPGKPRRSNQTSPSASQGSLRSSVAGKPTSDDEFDEDTFEKLESWQIEYTPLKANLMDPGITQALLEYNRVWQNTPIDTQAEPNGWHIAPFASMKENESGMRHARQGLTPTGNEAVPIRIQCHSLTDIAARTHIRAISDQVINTFFANVLYLQPLASEPQTIWSASKTFCRPVMHGVFTEISIPAGAFITEFRAEVYDAGSYRSYAPNQYDKIGTTKPHVHLFPSPLNIALDARRYGNTARFIRSSCHPNAVLRPILHSSSQSPPTLKFGVFALGAIARHHEVTLGWEWDDDHLVHLLPAVARWDAAHHDRSDADSGERVEFPYASTVLAAKFHALMSTLLSATTCACFGPTVGGNSAQMALLKRQNCAVTQMLHLSQGMAFFRAPSKAGAKSKPINLSPLVGAWRDWYGQRQAGDAPSQAVNHYVATAKDAGHQQDGLRENSSGDREITMDNDEQDMPQKHMSNSEALAASEENLVPERKQTEDVDTMQADSDAESEASIATQTYSEAVMPYAPDDPTTNDALVNQALAHLETEHKAQADCLQDTRSSSHKQAPLEPTTVSRSNSNNAKKRRTQSSTGVQDKPRSKRQRARAMLDPLTSESEEEWDPPSGRITESEGSTGDLPAKITASHSNYPRVPGQATRAIHSDTTNSKKAPTFVEPLLDGSLRTSKLVANKVSATPVSDSTGNGSSFNSQSINDRNQDPVSKKPMMNLASAMPPESPKMASSPEGRQVSRWEPKHNSAAPDLSSAQEIAAVETEAGANPTASPNLLASPAGSSQDYKSPTPTLSTSTELSPNPSATGTVPKKKLSLAEYKQRLASKRKSKQGTDVPATNESMGNSITSPSMSSPDRLDASGLQRSNGGPSTPVGPNIQMKADPEVGSTPSRASVVSPRSAAAEAIRSVVIPTSPPASSLDEKASQTFASETRVGHNTSPSPRQGDSLPVPSQPPTSLKDTKTERSSLSPNSTARLPPIPKLSCSEPFKSNTSDLTPGSSLAPRLPPPPPPPGPPPPMPPVVRASQTEHASHATSPNATSKFIHSGWRIV